MRQEKRRRWIVFLLFGKLSVGILKQKQFEVNGVINDYKDGYWTNKNVILTSEKFKSLCP